MQLRRRCKCGCGSITNYGKKWVSGHNSKTNTPILMTQSKTGVKNPNYKHGFRYHKLYNVWRNMKARCYNSNADRYQDYGGRGIRVFIRWRYSVKAFYNWSIKNGWEEGLEIDREDNDGNYHPNNCRFVTSKVNNNNQRKRKIAKNNTTGFKGVSFHKVTNKYQAYPIQLSMENKNILDFLILPKKRHML